MLLYEDFKYRINGSTVSITRYTGSDSTVSVPSQIDGLPVTSIGYWVFRGCNSLEYLIIPDSVGRLGDMLCEGCKRLKWVYVRKVWSDKNIGNIFGNAPDHKIFRTVNELKSYLKQQLRRLGNFSVLADALNEKFISKKVIWEIVAPAVNELEDLFSLRESGTRCR